MSPALEESWQALVEAMEALDFDGVSCQLSQWPNGSAPSYPPGGALERRHRTIAGASPSHCAPTKKPWGSYRFGALNKGRLLFQFSSLLDTLIPPFEKQLKRRYDAEEAPWRDVACGQVLPCNPLSWQTEGKDETTSAKKKKKKKKGS